MGHLLKRSGIRLAAGLALTAAGPGRAAPARTLPPPPIEAVSARDFPDWTVEHVAFAMGHTGQPVGGPARWAVGGVLPSACQPADQAGRDYDGSPDSDTRLYFYDQRRRFWILERGEAWPIAGCDDLGEEDGPGHSARFLYSGVYGGHLSGLVAMGHTLYAVDCGRLRRIRRQDDGTWAVDTIAGLGTGAAGTLGSLRGLGKGLTIDPAGNLYFTLGGGLVKASPDGSLATLITRERAQQDLAAIYGAKWPGAKVPAVALGQGEGVNLIWHTDGAIYGGGRTWPSTWKVTPDGAFVPLVNFAPKERMLPGRWGPGDPACYEPHCSMGWGLTRDGRVWHQNEIPWARSRYESDRQQVTVLDRDLTWQIRPPDYKGFFKLPESMSLNSDCTMGQGNAVGPFHSRSMWVRIRRAPKPGANP